MATTIRKRVQVCVRRESAAAVLAALRAADAKGVVLHAMAAFGLIALLFGAWPRIAHAGPVRRVAVTDGNVIAVLPAAGRVFWTTWGGDASVFSASLAGDRRRLLRLRDLDFYDDVSAEMWGSESRVVVRVETYMAGPEEDYYDVRSQTSAPVWATQLRELQGGEIGHERPQDIDGHTVLTTAERRIRGRWTIRPYVRDLTRPGARPRPVGVRMVLARDEFGDQVEARITGRWLATLRRGTVPRVTIYDRRTNQVAWRVRLPAWRGSAATRYGRGVVWDLADDGTVAVALHTGARGRPARRQELGWAPPRSTYRRVSGSVVVGTPFVVRQRVLTYAQHDGEDARVLYQRRLDGPPHAVTGRLPVTDEWLASDGRLVVAAVRGAGGTGCILAAELPVPASERWACRR